MNKIYKVIYSKVRNCYVVVSELAKNQRKCHSVNVKGKTALAAAILLALTSFCLTGMPSVAQAADGTESLRNNDFVGANDQYWYYDEKKGEWTTYQYALTSAFNNRARGKLPNYQGGGAKLPGAITAGLYAQAGQQTVTIGDRNAGQSKGSVFIGERSGYNNGDNAPAGMTNNYVTSVGFQSNATGWGSIAIGSNATAENSKMESQVVKEVGDAHTSGTVSDDTYGIEENPTIQGASVALGYNAHSNDGNIAIGSYSDATSTDKGDSYVSVGNGTLKRRITNVAKGTDNSDVVTVGQMNDAIKQADNLNVNAGWGINVADENDPTNTGKGTKNVISLKHNLGTGYNDAEANGMIIGGLVEDRDSAKHYGAADANSVVVGAGKALASGKSSVVVGGLDNVASGATSVVVGGDNNNAAGNQSAVFGGRNNTAGGIASTAGGGIMNVANGQQAVALGGAYNYALGVSSTAIGGTGGNGMYGYSTSVNGNYSVSLAGGSTGTDALNGLAAGNQSVVTTANGTAVGYQATTDKEGTIAFGHDAGDVSGYTIEWNKLPKGQVNADGTANDYTKAPKSVTPTKYKDAYYNRLVKVADGQDDHDVVVMEQLTKATNDLTKDLSVNAGWGINVADEKDTKTGEVTKKNVISLNRNLGTNYGNPWKGEGKVTFEAGGENSMILGGAASILFNNEKDDVKAGAYGKDSVLVGGFNNLIDTVANDVTQTGEDAVIVGGDTNTVTGLRSVIVGGYQNTVSGGHSIVIGGASNEADGGGAGVFGGQSNKAAGGYSSVLGGDHNEADGDWSSAIGGTTNTASGLYATTLGGINNDAKGNESVVVGGGQNVAIGEDSTVNGGADNTSYGSSSYAAGGMKNMAFGNASVALGGKDSSVNGKASTGIAGGSTGENAIFTLAAGYQSVVADSGVEWRPITQDEADKINQGIKSWPGYSGVMDLGEDSSVKVLDRISTAVGYQSTADAPGVIAFGHDKGDVASVAKKWKQKATMEVDDNYSVKYYDANHKEISADDYNKLVNSDGTLNDYTQDPIETETTYQSAYYNRLVKAADGIDAHDAVVMEQLKPYTKSDASNIGANLKTYTVGDDGETITEADATADQKKTNKDDWGKALGAEPFTTGTSDAATDASTSDQLVTGKTLYNYDAPVAETGKKLNYVSANNTTGQNLLNLDRQVKTNTDTLSDVNSWSVKYDTKTENGKTVVDNTKITLAGEGGTTITNLKGGVNDNDAATVGQLNSKIAGVTYTAGNGIAMDSTAKTISAKAGNGITVDTNGINAKAGTGITVNANGINVNTGKHLSVNTNGQVDVDDNGKVAENDGNLVTGDTVYKALNGGMKKIIIGTPGKDGKDGKDGTPGTIGLVGPAGTNGKDGVVDITIQKGEDGKDGTKGANGVDGKNGINRIVYEDKNGKHQVATMEDGLKFAGDDGQNDATKAIAKKLNNTVDIIGGADSTKLTANNIGVNNVDGKLKIQLAKNLAGITSIANQTTTGKGDAQTTTGAKIDLKDDGSISVNSGKITDVKSGLTATDGTYADTDKNNAANIGDVHSMIEKEAGNTDDKLALKANVAADNIGTHITDTTAQKTNLDNWGEAIGTGKIADPDASDKETNGSKQLVTGGTVYNEVRPSKDGEYVKMSQTTGANLLKLDDQVKQNAQNISDNTYTQGDGILMDKTKKTISVNKGDGLKFTEDHKLAVYTGNGLKIDNGAVAIKTSDSNLKVDSNGIGLSDKITIGSDKTKQVTIDGTNGEISGLTNTTWDSKANDYSNSTKAATESQVDAAVKDAVKQAGENDIHVAAGSYAVNDQNQVSMNLVDKNNDTKGTVIITDVAKSSEMGDVSKLADGVKNAGGKTTTVVDAINNVNTSMNTKIGDQKYSTSNTSGSNKYVQDGDSITSAIGKLDGAVQQATTAAGQHSTVSAGSNITVTPAKKTDGHTDYQVALNKDITVDSVTAKTATTDTLTVNKSATIGGVTIANKTISNLSDTKIEKGSTNAVNAGTIWNELRPSGGTYINQNNTTAQNITNLDTQVKKNSDLVNSDGSTIKIGGKDSATKVDISDKNGSGRVVTGVVTDTNDASSAANVGYVNNMAAANTQQIYRDMNNAYGRLDNNINRAAAGSNALAALHPLEYDPDDKLSFAMGYGHYHNANAAAVGAFYQPNSKTQFNFGVALGNGDPGFNAGIAFKLGKSSPYAGMNRVTLIHAVQDLKASDEAKDKRIDALEKENQEMKKQLQAIMAKLNG